jgi:hypothetical protein
MWKAESSGGLIVHGKKQELVIGCQKVAFFGMQLTLQTRHKHRECVQTLNRTIKERPSLQTQRSTAARAENLQHNYCRYNCD